MLWRLVLGWRMLQLLLLLLWLPLGLLLWCCRLLWLGLHSSVTWVVQGGVRAWMAVACFCLVLLVLLLVDGTTW